MERERAAVATGAAEAEGGRPRIPDRAALTGSRCVQRIGCPWDALPAEVGCGRGVTCWRRLREWQAAGVGARRHYAPLNREGARDEMPPLPGLHGRPRRQPAKLPADTGLTSLAAAPPVGSVVERTLAWLARFRRLAPAPSSAGTGSSRGFERRS